MLKIEFEAKGRKFVSAKGVQIDDFKPNFVSGDGWRCNIRADGSIKCDAIEIRDGKYYQTTFKVDKKGKAIITRVNAGVRTQVFCQTIKKWPTDGVIKLTGGKTEERRGYFIRAAKATKEEG